MSRLDNLYKELLAEVGDSQQSTLDLLTRYCTLLGHTNGPVPTQIKDLAQSEGVSVTTILDRIALGLVVTTTVPDAPTIGTATAGDAEATVTFTPPANDGGSAITGYTATSSPGGLTATGAGSPLTVTGLTNDTAYTFTVVATNANGNSAASAASNSVTPTFTNLHPNGTFDTATGWVLGTGQTVSAGVLDCNQTANANATYDLTSLSLAAGTYRVEWQIVSATSGNYTARFASVNEGTLLGTTITYTAGGINGVYTDDFVVTSSPTSQSFRVTLTAGAAVGTLDNVKIYKIA